MDKLIIIGFFFAVLFIVRGHLKDGQLKIERKQNEIDEENEFIGMGGPGRTDTH